MYCIYTGNLRKLFLEYYDWLCSLKYSLINLKPSGSYIEMFIQGHAK